jgi:hypothetical protein
MALSSDDVKTVKVVELKMLLVKKKVSLNSFEIPSTNS